MSTSISRDSYPQMKKVDRIIVKYLSHNPDLFDLYMTHVSMVRDRALEIARRVAESRPDIAPDLTLVEEASMLHDIGIYKTDAADIFCMGKAPYIAHGSIGREILEAEGMPLHALIAERHTGSGISLAQIIADKMPVPERDMLPISIEEKIVCFADCFYSKAPGRLREEKAVADIRAGLARFGQDALARFDEMADLFGWPR